MREPQAFLWMRLPGFPTISKPIHHTKAEANWKGVVVGLCPWSNAEPSQNRRQIWDGKEWRNQSWDNGQDLAIDSLSKYYRLMHSGWCPPQCRDKRKYKVLMYMYPPSSSFTSPLSLDCTIDTAVATGRTQCAPFTIQQSQCDSLDACKNLNAMVTIQ